MFGSTILDAAIGIVFIYLLASLVISAANEFIARRHNSLENVLAIQLKYISTSKKHHQPRVPEHGFCQVAEHLSASRLQVANRMNFPSFSSDTCSCPWITTCSSSG